MVEDIQEKLQEYFTNIQIDVEYESIRKYKIKLTKKYPILKETNNNDIIKKSVTFYYNWIKHFTFTANIEQMKYIIDKYFRLYLESEENNENN